MLYKGVKEAGESGSEHHMLFYNVLPQKKYVG